MSNIEFSSRYIETESTQEKCGITAVYSKRGVPVSHLTGRMLYHMRHRGRDSAGIASYDSTQQSINTYHARGNPDHVFPPRFPYAKFGVLSDRSIGHTRYATDDNGAHKDDPSKIQPVFVEYGDLSLALAHNGNVPSRLRSTLRERIPAEMSMEPELDSADIARAIVSAEGRSWEERIQNGLEGVPMAYALTMLTGEGDVYGVVGPSGTWPLWVGENEDTIVMASETRVENGTFSDMRWREVKPGQLVKATPRGVMTMQLFSDGPRFRSALHDDYGARGDSMMTESLTYADFRRHKGKLLAQEFPIEADIYAGIPQTGLDIMDGYADELGKTATHIIHSNGIRSFIAQNPTEAQRVVQTKFAIEDPEQVKGKKVVVGEDSLIKGTTMEGIVALLRTSGAAQIHVLLSLAPFVDDCDLGYYIRKDQLAAIKKHGDSYNRLSAEEIARKIGADSVNYLSLESIKDAYGWAFGDRDAVCLHCMGEPHPLDIMESNARAKDIFVSQLVATKS